MILWLQASLSQQFELMPKGSLCSLCEMVVSLLKPLVDSNSTEVSGGITPCLMICDAQCDCQSTGRSTATFGQVLWYSSIELLNRGTNMSILSCALSSFVFSLCKSLPPSLSHTSSLSLPSCRCFTCTRSPAVNTVSLACNTILFSGLGAFGDLCGEFKQTYRHPLSNMLMWMTMLFCRTTLIKSVRSLTSVTPPLLISKWVCSCDWDFLQWLCLNHWL